MFTLPPTLVHRKAATSLPVAGPVSLSCPVLSTAQVHLWARCAARRGYVPWRTQDQPKTRANECHLGAIERWFRRMP